jgi:two-component system NtrC family sensor kinase
VRPTPLRALREVAAVLGSGRSLDEVGPEALGECRIALGASGVALWIERSKRGLVPEWQVGANEVGAEDVEAALARDADADSGPLHLHAASLAYEGRRLGALVARGPLRLTDDDALFLQIVADMLAPMLAGAEYAQRLEFEVAARTAEIERQRRFVAKVVDSLPVGLYVVDRDFRVQAWNRKRETGMQGVSRADAIGRPVFDVLHRQPADVLRAELSDVFATGEVQQFQTESRASGEVRTFRITKIPMRLDDRGPVSHVITVGEDVTEWREAQERIAQAEKLAAIGTLTAGVMHEINNPLATIAACAEATAMRVEDSAVVVADEPLRRALSDAFGMIQSEVHRCKRIVDGLLDVSRPKSLEKEPLDLSAVVERTLFLLKHHSRFKLLTVDVEAWSGEPPIVLAAEEQLIQVFMALLLNAMDAMHDRGTIAMRLRVEGDWVNAEVEDHGDGIRGANLKKIFEPFFTTKPPGRGTGLGLSICYAIIAEHGGRIEVDSVVGRGSVFRIVLPRAFAAARAEHP